LKAGAMGAATSKHLSAVSYSQSGASQHITTIDEVHPTDQMYRLIWREIYEQIKRSDVTFGKLSSVLADTPLATLAGPSQQTRNDFGAVMNQIGASPQSRLKNTRQGLW
jgi:hypothetical protein